MKRSLSLPYTYIASISATVWLALIVMLANGVNSEHVIFRFALLVIATALSAKILSGPSRTSLLSPVYLLGLIALVFYSLLPAVYTRFPETFRVGAAIHKMTMAYPGGTAELLIMQFSALCFMLVATYCHFQKGSTDPSIQGKVEPRGRLVFATSVALVVLGVAIIGANFHVAAVNHVLSDGIGREILDAQAPLLSFCLATLAYIATDRFRAIIVFITAMFILVGLTASGLSRIPIFIVLSPLVLLLAIKEVTWKSIAKFSGVAMAVVVVSVVLVVPIRSYLNPQNWPKENFFDWLPTLHISGIKHQVIIKLIARQSISGWCFDRVTRIHLNWNNQGNPLFFVTAIAPKMIWPKKPSLSRGSEYATKYCGMEASPDAPHSESLTLLGEPVINGGVIGIGVAQAFLLAGLLVVNMLARRAGVFGLISLAAMLPWLIQFEQHFALYFANAVKMFLFMTPIVVAWLILSRKTERGRNEQPTGQ